MEFVLFEQGFYLKILKVGWGFLHDIMRQNIAARNEHFVYAFVDISVVSVSDIRFCKLAPFCTTRFNDTIFFMTFQRFPFNYRLDSGTMQE